MKKKEKTKENDLIVRVFEDEETISTWTYDYAINRYGPISVEIVYKNEPIVEKKKKGNGRKRKTLG
jgi:hypothetical protein